MGLFDKFKKKDDNSPANEQLIKAKEHFDKGEYQETLRTLIWGFKNDPSYKPLYKLASESFGKLNVPEEKQLFDAVNNNFNDSRAFNNLADFYFQVGHYDLAQVFCERTLKLNPKAEGVAHDLAICYARRFQISKAVEVLTNANSNDFWDLYFLNKCKILDGKTERVGPAVNELKIFLDNQGDQEGIEVPKMKVNELLEMLERYNSIAPPRKHIRDWQYIQYGGVILDYFEDGEDLDVAGGRYVASWGSNESIKEISVKLRLLCEKLNLKIETVAALEDRDSTILGLLIAKELNAKFETYNKTGLNNNCLVVCSDSSQLNSREELNEIKSGQILFSLNHGWLDSCAVSPDIIGFMTQTYTFPWTGGGFRMIDGKLEKTEADNRTPDLIAAEIYAIEQEKIDFDEHLEFYLKQKDYLKGIGTQTNSNRYNFMIESPIPGSYFG